MRKHKTFKRTLSLLLCVIMLFGSAPLAGLAGLDLPNLFAQKAEATSNKITGYNVGDIVEFGRYPQSKVTDESVISSLNSLVKVDNTSTETITASTSVANGWTSYNYYSNGVSSDYMRYTDVVYNDNKYRGVVFDSYRPSYTDNSSSANNSYQDDNGYNINTVYWFKYEPIKWRVLDPSTGMVMSETILDSQAYNNYLIYSNGEDYGNADKTYYANNYEKSSIRQWLNEDFYNAAFSASQKNLIETTKLDNSAYSDPRPQSGTYMIDCSHYSSCTTEDRIYILSYADATNESYGFSASFAEQDIARRANGSDYADIQGFTEASLYWLRSAGYYSYYVWHINSLGYIGCGANPDESDVGIRPVLNLKREAVMCNCKIEAPSTRTISYGDSIILHASAENLPSGAKIVWEADNGNFGYSVSSDGTTCTITPEKSGDTVFTAKIVDKDGNVISSATQKMTSKAGLWQKIVAFFKNLFGKNQVIPYIAKIIS